jgi:hypothetical protein
MDRFDEASTDLGRRCRFLSVLSPAEVVHLIEAPAKALRKRTWTLTASKVARGGFKPVAETVTQPFAIALRSP